MTCAWALEGHRDDMPIPFMVVHSPGTERLVAGHQCYRERLFCI